MKRKDKRKLQANKIKTIDSVITMQDLAEELQSTISNLYCGYLRQPITHDRIIADNYIIHGVCSLTRNECSYAVSSLSYHGCDICPIYKGWLNDRVQS